MTEDRTMLDLTAMRSPNDLQHLTELRDIQLVAVPESLASYVHRLPQQDVTLVATVPDGLRLRTRTGMTQVSGDSLSYPNAHKEFLAVVGALIFTSPVTKIDLAGMAVVGAVLAPIGSERAISTALSSVVGLVTYFPYVEGQQIKAHSGQTTLNAATLEDTSGGPDNILLVAGQLVVTGDVRSVAYREIIAVGQAILPRASQDVLGPVMRVEGQTIWYRGTTPRLIMGEEEFGQQFLELVDEPISLIVFGHVRFSDDVSPDILRAKVAEIVLFGSIRAPKNVIPVVQFLTPEKFGVIEAVEDSVGDA